MPQLEKTLTCDLEELEKKINMGIISNCPLTSKRGRWETTVNGVKCVMLVYEQHAEKVLAHPENLPGHWDKDYKPSWFNLYAHDAFEQAPHYSITITMLDNGEEIKLCAITAGSGQDHYFIPDSGAEYGLFEALDLTLERLDIPDEIDWLGDTENIDDMDEIYP